MKDLHDQSHELPLRDDGQAPGIRQFVPDEADTVELVDVGQTQEQEYEGNQPPVPDPDVITDTQCCHSGAYCSLVVALWPRILPTHAHPVVTVTTAAAQGEALIYSTTTGNDDGSPPIDSRPCRKHSSPTLNQLPVAQLDRAAVS